jgi:hypothetical protein
MDIASPKKDLFVPKTFHITNAPGTKDWTGDKIGKMWIVPGALVEAKRKQDPEMFQEQNGKRLELWLQSIAPWLPGRT